MAKKAAPKKHTPRVAKKSLFEKLSDKKHRPLHVAGLGTIMVFLQGLIAVVGVILIIGAALTYGMRALKANR